MAVGRSRIVLAFGAILLPILAAAAVELALRIFVAPRGAPQTVRFDGAVPDDAVLTVFDRELLFRLAPSSELLGFYRTNAEGHRDEEFTAPSESRFRILAIGDSCTFGLGVAEAETWPARLESLLDAAFLGVTDFEVLNLGVPGYSSFQNRRQIEREATRLHAHGVVWMVTGYNDALLARTGSDAEIARRLASPWSRLADLRIVQLFAGEPSGFMGEGAQLAKLSGGAPRVSVEEFDANVAAILAPDPARATLSIEVFATPLHPSLAAFDPSIPARRERLVSRLADRRGAIDPASRFKEFGEYDLFVDSVHPGAEGQHILAEVAFSNILRGDFLAASSRRDWLRAVLDAWDRRVTESDAERLGSDGALPWFATLLATDANPVAFADAARFDPIHGTDRGEYECGRLGLIACEAISVEGPEPSRAVALRGIMREHVVPADPFDRMTFGDSDPSPPSTRVLATARCLVILRRWLGMPTFRVDDRVARLLASPDPNAALAEFDDVLALEPTAWIPRRAHAELLRKAERVEEAKAALDALLLERPNDARSLALLGMIALTSGDHGTARGALEKSLAADPVQVEALYGLGRIALFEGRFEDAARRLGAAKSLRPSTYPDLGRLLEMAARRERLERVNR